jgi:hypothetical protein
VSARPRELRARQVVLAAIEGFDEEPDEEE